LFLLVYENPACGFYAYAHSCIFSRKVKVSHFKLNLRVAPERVQDWGKRNVQALPPLRRELLVAVTLLECDCLKPIAIAAEVENQVGVPSNDWVALQLHVAKD
jgi:hypothetical protein